MEMGISMSQIPTAEQIPRDTAMGTLLMRQTAKTIKVMAIELIVRPSVCQ